MPKLNLLVNLSPEMLSCPVVQPYFKRMSAYATLRKRSFDRPEEIARDMQWADAVIMNSWPVHTLDSLERTKLQYCGHLDLNQRGAKALLAHGVPTSISRKGYSPAVSEMALGLILNCLRGISTYHDQMRRGKEPWVKRFPGGVPAVERQLMGRTVGIIGFGQVGQRLGELLAPFWCTLNIYDPHLPDVVLQKFGAKKMDLHGLIRASEIVVLCAASNAGTNHLIGGKELKLFKKDAVLINVARAALVDTKALVGRLKKQDMFAAIDVFDKEPLEKSSPLRKLPNAFLTPHRAGGLYESVERIVGFLVDDLEAYLAGKPRQHALTEQMIPALDAW